MVVEDFIVQRGEELRETHLLFRRDLLERVPERHNESSNYHYQMIAERALLRARK